jgi:hypothetical protein
MLRRLYSTAMYHYHASCPPFHSSKCNFKIMHRFQRYRIEYQAIMISRMHHTCKTYDCPGLVSALMRIPQYDVQIRLRHPCTTKVLALPLDIALGAPRKILLLYLASEGFRVKSDSANRCLSQM